MTDPDNPIIKLENMQIINGCQTATALALAEREGILESDVRVLLRIYQTTDEDLISKIVMTTNNQNEISSRDLKANDLVQIDMERALKNYDYLYERKLRQYDNMANIDINRIIPNELLAQSYLSIVLKKPSDARARKYKIWRNYYDQIFGGRGVIEPYIISFLMYKLTENWLKISGLSKDPDISRSTLAKKGTFHIARMASFIWRKDDNWTQASHDLKREVKTLENNPTTINEYIEKAYSILQKILTEDARFSSDLDNALKSSNLDIEIDKVLHTT